MEQSSWHQSDSGQAGTWTKSRGRGGEVWSCSFPLQASLTQCAPGRWRGAAGPCPSCPSGSHQLRSAAGTHTLSESPGRETDRELFISFFYCLSSDSWTLLTYLLTLTHTDPTIIWYRKKGQINESKLLIYTFLTLYKFKCFCGSSKLGVSPRSRPVWAASSPPPPRSPRVRQHRVQTPRPWAAGCADARSGRGAPRGAAPSDLPGPMTFPARSPPRHWTTPPTPPLRVGKETGKENKC